MFCRWERSYNPTSFLPKRGRKLSPLPLRPPHHHHQYTATRRPQSPAHHHTTYSNQTSRQEETTTTSIPLLDTFTCCGTDHRWGSRLRGSRAGLSEIICKQHGDKNGALFVSCLLSGVALNLRAFENFYRTQVLCILSCLLALMYSFCAFFPQMLKFRAQPQWLIRSLSMSCVWSHAA